MATIEKSIEVEAPLSMVYNQWTQFESWPVFMRNVDEVRQLDDKHLHWKANIGGKTKEWDADITEQIPDRSIAWRSVSGAENSGRVEFHETDKDHTRINLWIHYEPAGAVEKIASGVGIVSFHVEGDLEHFKEFIESRGVETGAWRGKIEGSEVKPESQGSPSSTIRSTTTRPGKLET